MKDECSRMPFIAEVKTTAAGFVIPVLNNILSLVGIPEVLKSDNGPPFNGHEYREFCEYMGIVPRFITPEHQKANGMYDRFMQNIGKVIRCAIIGKKPYQ